MMTEQRQNDARSPRRQRLNRYMLGLALAAILWLPATASADPCSTTRAHLKTRLAALISTQTPSGGLVFADEDELLAQHPLLATLGLDIYKHDGDAYMLQRIHDASSRYISYILARSDEDGDFVLERSSWGEPSAMYEDAGYNAMFALDLLNLSRICVATDRTVDALYWYQGMQTIARQLVRQTYDASTRFFLPMNSSQGQRENLYYATSLLPVYFEEHVGDNLSRSIMTHYLSNDRRLIPETPYRYLKWDSADENLVDGIPAAHALRSALMLGTMHDHDMENEAKIHAENITRAVAARSLAPNDEYANYFTCLIREQGYQSLFPKHYDLDLFLALARLPGVLPQDKLAALDQGIAVCRNFLDVSQGDLDETQIQTVEHAIRQVYLAISAMRPRWRTRNLFMPRERTSIPGFDIYPATDDVMNVVMMTLRRIESDLTSVRATREGLQLSTTALGETVITGDPARFRFALGATNDPIGVKSMVVLHNQAVDTLIGAPIELTRASEEKQYWYEFVPQSDTERLEITEFSVAIQLVGGKRLRFHYRFGIYITDPVTQFVTFPKGKLLNTSTLPVEIYVTKHVNRSYAVNAEWFSPAGINPFEGRSYELYMPEEMRTGLFKMNVLVPDDCRPGEFPFRVKIFYNGRESGIVSASLFKHYEWVFIGPFPITDGGLYTPYPPEQTVDLQRTYTGAIRPVSWKPLSRSAHRDNGELDLTALLPRESIAYLHTAVKTSMEKQTTLTLSTGQQAMVFVNGEEVLHVDKSMLGSPQRAKVALDYGNNSILIKLLSGEDKSLYFRLGDGDGLTPDEFNNKLVEIVDGYDSFYKRSENIEVTESQRVVTLTYEDPSATSVSVIGSFNGWSPVNSHMKRTREGEWEISLHLAPGRYTYRFLVDNGTQVLDPSSVAEEPDGYGGKNSVLTVR